MGCVAPISQQVLAEIKKFFGTKVYQTVIPRNVRLAEAPSHGQPALVYDRTSSGASAYLSFAREFLDRRGALVPLSVALVEGIPAP
jgi:chromosome partitioning protein